MTKKIFWHHHLPVIHVHVSMMSIYLFDPIVLTSFF